MMPPAGYAPTYTASALVDVDGDGQPDYLVSGVDLNNDGIPDVLQVMCCMPRTCSESL